MSSKYRTTLNVKRLTEFRHDLHMHPELKFMEHRTSDKIAAFLTELDIPYKRGLAFWFYAPGGTWRIWMDWEW